MTCITVKYERFLLLRKLQSKLKSVDSKYSGWFINWLIDWVCDETENSTQEALWPEMQGFVTESVKFWISA